jgi:hypothetical protein
MAVQWQYKVILLNSAKRPDLLEPSSGEPLVQGYLNAEGDDGWELVAVTDAPELATHENPGPAAFYFKKLKV